MLVATDWLSLEGTAFSIVEVSKDAGNLVIKDLFLFDHFDLILCLSVLARDGEMILMATD